MIIKYRIISSFNFNINLIFENNNEIVQFEIIYLIMSITDEDDSCFSFLIQEIAKAINN